MGRYSLGLLVSESKGDLGAKEGGEFALESERLLADPIPPARGGNFDDRRGGALFISRILERVVPMATIGTAHRLSPAFLLLLGASAGTACRSTGGPPPVTQPPPGPQIVLVEVDHMEGVPRLSEAQVLRGVNVSLGAIYAPADIRMEVRHDQTDLPRRESLRLADLHALMTSFQSVPAPAGAWKLYVLVATRDAGDPDTLGIMFDFGSTDRNDLPREGCAIFAGAHDGLPGGAAPEMLLTAAHELAHCFNLHHPDWEGTSFQRDATIESYSLTDSVRWSLSPQSRDHLRSAPRSLVRPGSGGLGFGLVTEDHLRRHRASPEESFQVVDAARAPELRRGVAIPREAAVRTAAARNGPRRLAPADHPLRLSLASPKRTYLAGEPVVLVASLRNSGTAPVEALDLLRPEFRFLNLEISAPGAGGPIPFRPAILAEGRGRPTRTLAPGGSIHEEVKLFFGAEGWTFIDPGIYRVRADFPAGPLGTAGADEGEARIEAPSIEIEIREPATETDRRARSLLGHEEGLYLLLEGADHLEKASANLRTIAREHPRAACAPAARLALGQAALDPTIEPRQRSKPRARLQEAEELLNGLLDTGLPKLSLLRTKSRLADALEEGGQTRKASEVRRRTIQKLEKDEATQQGIENIRRKLQTQPPSTPPGQ